MDGRVDAGFLQVNQGSEMDMDLAVNFPGERPDREEALNYAREQIDLMFGIRFFGDSADSIGFISLESADLYRDIVWGPLGDRLVLVVGSGDRPESFFRVYDENMDMSMQLPGIRDELHWVDGVRFVFTCNLGRRANAFPGGGDELRRSVILYDTVMPAAIRLKDASDTHGFSLLSVADDGRTAEVRERSVASPDDWADVDRVRERILTVRVPAAG